MGCTFILDGGNDNCVQPSNWESTYKTKAGMVRVNALPHLMLLTVIKINASSLTV